MLLRRLRNSNLSAGPLAISGDFAVFPAGCSSLDFPAESGLRYRVRGTDGREGLLDLMLRAAGLELTAIGLQPLTAGGSVRVALRKDRQGGAFARELGVRPSQDTSDCRELERFLRRVVRAVFRVEECKRLGHGSRWVT